MTASQFESFIKNNVSTDLLNKTTGEFFVEEVFKPGALKRWDNLIESSTKEPLSPKFLTDQIKEE
jgi:peptidyl-dipeptidase A